MVRILYCLVCIFFFIALFVLQYLLEFERQFQLHMIAFCVALECIVSHVMCVVNGLVIIVFVATYVVYVLCVIVVYFVFECMYFV